MRARPASQSVPTPGCHARAELTWRPLGRSFRAGPSDGPLGDSTTQLPSRPASRRSPGWARAAKMADFEDRVSDEEKVRGPPLSFTSSPDGAQGSELAAVESLAVSAGKRKSFPGAGILPLHPGRFLPSRGFPLPHGGPSSPFLNSSFHSGPSTAFL